MRPRASLAPSDPSNERGAVLPIVALLLVGLMVFGALAVDLGYQYASKREAQSAADTAALGASTQLFVVNGDLQGAVDDAMALAEANTAWTISATDWENCTDPDALRWTAASLPGIAQNTECISFSGAFDEIRVRIPTADIDTFFAAVIGIDTLPVAAAAQASLRPPSGQATPPFVVLPPGSAGEQVCLRTSNNAALPGRWAGNGPGSDPENEPTLALASEAEFLPDPCDDLATTPQFFGTLKPYFYDDINPASGPDQSCSQINGAIPLGIAEGVDHPLSSFEPDYDFDPLGPQVRVDGDGCPQGPPVPWPNTLALQSGFTAQTLKDGFLAGGTIDGTSFTGRLHGGDFRQAGDPRFAGWQVESRPLWSFLVDDTACSELKTKDTDPEWDYFDKKEAMIDCLLDWEDSDGQLFEDELVEAARFAIIPVVAEASFGTTPDVHFNSFVPVFFQTLYQYGNRIGSPNQYCFAQAESASGNAGWYRQDAGQDFDCGQNNQNVDRVAAIILDCAMLDDDLCTPDPTPGPTGTPVYEILLTR